MKQAIQQVQSSLFDPPESPQSTRDATESDDRPVVRVPVPQEPPPSWGDSLAYYFGGR